MGGETGGLWDFLGRWFGWIFEGIRSGVEYVGKLLSNFLGALVRLLQPLWDILGGLAYLLWNIIDVIILVLQIFMLLLQVLFSVIGGITRTFLSLITWDPSQVQADYNPYAEGTNLLIDWFNQAGGDVIPHVLMWALWIAFAYAVLRLFSVGAGTSAD